MVHYRVYYTHPHRHFISFEARFNCKGIQSIQLQLPAWRPGRYELGNFSKNIRAWQSLDENGKPLPFKKLNKDLWEVNCQSSNIVVIQYEYYAADLNAGSSYLDESQLYINPVNCFFYDSSRPDTEYSIEFDLPSDYSIATGMSKKSAHVLKADSFDQLADCPIIASKELVTLEYEAENKKYYLHFQGEVKLDTERLLKEFKSFTLEQLKLFGGIPCREYHFLFHFLPYFVRHGVEHCNSTVIAMGPAADFQQDHLFKDLLGISCHELFHTWNIKAIRPVEMMPYNFTEENYTRSGFVAEGVTTYYGDYLLWRTGSFTNEDWFDVLTESMQTHFDNPGRFNHSVADSSFDTWLDGYSPGIPWRKVSIYNEGFLIAFICDIWIRHASAGRFSLDDVMKQMYKIFGITGSGYTTKEYCDLLMHYGGPGISEIINKLIFGKEDYKPFLKSALSRVGLDLAEMPSPKISESAYGLIVEESNTKITVQSVIRDSPADLAGLWIGDEIVSIERTAPYKNFQLLLKMKLGASEWQILRKNKLQSVMIEASASPVVLKYKITPKENPTTEMTAAFSSWKASCQ
ncbi:MAG: M61 family metallopeptidase [Flavobacteriales bacterium]